MIPVTFTTGDSSYDIALPATLPLAEVVPMVVDEMGLLTANAASIGFRVRDELGEVIPLDRTPEQAELAAGDVLRLELGDKREDERRYDDLVEALGDAVEARGTGWNGDDSLRVAVASAVALLLIVAIMLFQLGGMVALTAGAGAAIIAIAAAIVIARVGQPVSALIVHATAAVLAGAAATALFDDLGAKLIAAGAALVVVGGLGFVTLRGQRGQASPPIAGLVGVLYAGVMLLWAGLARAVIGLDAEFVAITTATATGLMLIVAPWIALAQTPMGVFIPRNDEERARDTHVYTDHQVRGHEAIGRAVNLSLKIAGGVVLLVCVPWIVSGGVAALVLLGAIGASLLLNTRQVYDRTEVLVGVITGAGALVGGAIFTALQQPHLAQWVVFAVILVAALVLAIGALNRVVSANLDRLADLLSVLALLTIIPAAVIALGFV